MNDLLLKPPRTSASSAVKSPPEAKAFVDAPRKRAHARKIKTPLGPFITEQTVFDHGTRSLEIVKITKHGITYRAVGRREEYTISHATVYERAVFQHAGFDAGPRESKRINRGTI